MVTCTTHLTCLIKLIYKKKIPIYHNTFEKLHSQYSCVSPEKCDSYVWAVKCSKITKTKNIYKKFQKQLFTGTKYSGLTGTHGIKIEIEVNTI